MPEQHFGPLITPDGVRFRVWAPGATRIDLLLEDRRLSMDSVGDGFFELLVADAGPGMAYRYERTGCPPLPDPASRFQPDGVHGASEVPDLGHRWRDGGWRGRAPRELVIYELHVGTFTRRGDYEGVIERLDHLAELGITAIELMPLAAFPGRRGWGYDGVFHFAPFAGYGRPAELMALVDECHARGIAVILDLVTNHFGPEGNAMWTLAPGFFRTDRPTSWSAGHAWELAPVMRYFDEAALCWIRDYHMDGLRLDAFHAVPSDIRAEHLTRMVRIVDEHLGSEDSERRVLFLLESIENESSLLRLGAEHVDVAQLNFDFQRASHALLTGERHGEYRDFHRPARELGRCLDEGFAFRGRFNSHAARVIGDGGKPERWGQLVNFLQNHDTCGNRHLGQRLDALTSSQGLLEAATALLLLHPAIPFLFMGQEWGAETPFHFFTDFLGELGQTVQEGRLKIFREMGPPPWPDAPACQDVEAFKRSILRWGERDQEMSALVRRALDVRRAVAPLMSDDPADLELSRQGGRYQLRIAAARAGEPPFLLCAHLESNPGAGPMALPEGQVLFTTRPLGGEIPPGAASLLRATS